MFGKELYYMVCVLVFRVIFGSWVDIGNGFVWGLVMRKMMINFMIVRGICISEFLVMYGIKDFFFWEMVYGYIGLYICEGIFFYFFWLFYFFE